MLRDYEDIRSRISDPVLCWDDNGVPRYGEFQPQKCGVYDIVVALVEVACQACQERFRVAVSFDESTIRQRGDKYTFPTEGEIGSFHYGDPPSHSHSNEGCAGNTMLAEAVRILEFWSRVDFNWVRRPEHEVYIGDHERKDDIADLL